MSSDHSSRLEAARPAFQAMLVLSAFTMAVYHVLFALIPLWGSSRHNIIHVGFAIGVALLMHVIKALGRPLFMGFLLLTFVLSEASIIYIFVNAEDLELQSGLFLRDFDFVVGLVLLITLMVVVLLQWGGALTAVTLIAIAYFFFGSAIPGPLGFPNLGAAFVMGTLGMGLGTGVFGFVTPVSATIIFYFMLFGGVLSSVGVLPLFLEIGKLCGRFLRGGAALSAVIGSSLVGTVTGVSAANVALTGQYTIPAMRSQGYPGPLASAIESASSGGGQIMPPVLGAAAFLMASFTGVPYFVIMTKSILLAILYYASLLITILIVARRLDIGIVAEKVDSRLLAKRLPVFLVPLGLLIYLLSQAHSPAWSVLWAIAATIIVAAFSRDTRPGLRTLLMSFVDGAIAGAEIALGVIAIAVVSQVAVTTGLGPKLASVLLSISDGSVWITLVLVMAGCLILGMGMATVAAYTIVALVMVPALEALGVNQLSAHFFVLYFAVFSAVTPPIAPSALIGSKIADAPFWSCAWQGVKMSLPLFLIPFGLIAEPQLLQFPYYGWGALYMASILLISGLALTSVLYRHLVLPLKGAEYGLAVAATALLCWFFVIEQRWAVALAGVALICFLLVRQTLRSRKMPAATRVFTPR